MTDDVDRYLESALDEALEAVGITWEDYTCAWAGKRVEVAA